LEKRNIHTTGPRVFFSILWCSWSGDHPWDDLARFGYILDMKVEQKKSKILPYSWLLMEVIIKIWRFRIIFFKIWRIGVISSMKMSLYRSKMYFSGRNFPYFWQLVKVI
jgi:hypothetical protein